MLALASEAGLEAGLEAWLALASSEVLYFFRLPLLPLLYFRQYPPRYLKYQGQVTAARKNSQLGVARKNAVGYNIYAYTHRIYAFND